MPDPLEQLAILKQKMVEIAEAAGLELEAFAILPGEPGEQHHAQAIFKIDPKRTFKSQEERDTDQEFEMLMRMNKVQEHEQAVEDITTNGPDLLKGLEDLKNGIGLDDTGEPDDTDQDRGDPAGV